MYIVLLIMPQKPERTVSLMADRPLGSYADFTLSPKGYSFIWTKYMYVYIGMCSLKGYGFSAVLVIQV